MNVKYTTQEARQLNSRKFNQMQQRGLEGELSFTSQDQLKLVFESLQEKLSDQLCPAYFRIHKQLRRKSKGAWRKQKYLCANFSALTLASGTVSSSSARFLE